MSCVCYNCFREKSSYGPCPACGYDPAGEAEKYPLALKPGSILNGRYVVGRVLGQGGFGITYLAQEYASRERVAIKEYLPTDFAGRDSGSSSVLIYSGERRENFEYGKAQFLEEAKTLAAFIGDEHIVRIYSYFEENNTAYFVMEYVDGYALDKYMAQKGGRLTPDEANRLLLPLMNSLAAVHAKGIIHRDIAPDNILITKEGTAKLIDFGAARYSTGEKSKSLDVVLKHGFAPKEQYLRRGRQGPFTDIYALAATYYYTITGKIPPESIERMDEDELIPPSSLGVRLSSRAEDALFKALEVNAQDRYQSMTVFLRAMTAAAGSSSASYSSAKSKQNELNFSAPIPFSSQGRTEQEIRAEAELLEQRAKEARAEAERLERERREREARIEAARLEQERREREAREEAARLERERKAKEAREAEERRRQEARAEAERLKKERAEQKAREETERQEKLRLEREKREEEKRLAAEKKKKEAEEKERLRQEALAKQKAEQEQKRAEAESLKKEREEQKARQAKEKAVLRRASKEKQPENETSGNSTSDSALVEVQTKKRSAKKVSLFAAIAAILIAGVAVGLYFSPGQVAKRNYDKGIQLMETGQYSEAIAQFELASDFSDVQEPISAAWYAKGLTLKDTEDWDAAIAAFEHSGDYEDSQKQIQEIRNELQYREGINCLAAGEYDNALNLFESLCAAGYKDSEEKKKEVKTLAIIYAKPGDTIFFGSYEQDNNLTNGKEDIEWLVLEKENGRIFVVSKQALDCQPFNIEQKTVTWETCSLRKWLNNDFLSAAFNAGDQKCIPTVTVTAERYPGDNADPGNDTFDSIFLLSNAEVQHFFATQQARMCSPTAYAKANGAYVSSSTDTCNWWLRTVVKKFSVTSYFDKKYQRLFSASYIPANGILASFNPVAGTSVAIRPAMWININDIQAAAHYSEGLVQKESGNWDGAILAFEQAGDFMDAKDWIDEIRHEVEMRSLADSKAGDVVYYGSYEQDNDLENGKEPIEWLVLDNRDDKLLLISTHALDCQPYNREQKTVTWETCSLRKWLNNDFLTDAFSVEEQKRIPAGTVTADKGEDSPYDRNNQSVDQGKDTHDKVFLLSSIEAKTYFSSNSARECRPTTYAIVKGVYTSNTTGNCAWWLRTSDRSIHGSGKGASCIGVDGSAVSIGAVINGTTTAVRPAIWVNWGS